MLHIKFWTFFICLTSLIIRLISLNFVFNVLKVNINVIRNFMLKVTFNDNISIDKCYKEL